MRPEVVAAGNSESIRSTFSLSTGITRGRSHPALEYVSEVSLYVTGECFAAKVTSVGSVSVTRGMASFHITPVGEI